jgi:hypothetical protein
LRLAGANSSQDPTLKIPNIKKKGWWSSSSRQCLPSKHDALVQTSVLTKRKKKKSIWGQMYGSYCRVLPYKHEALSLNPVLLTKRTAFGRFWVYISDKK